MMGFVWSFINIFVRKAILGVLAVILGNYLSPHDMGVFVALFMFVTYSMTLLGFELGSALIHRLNTNRSAIKNERYYSAGLLILLLASSIFSLLIGSFFHPVISLFRLNGYESLFLLMLPLMIVRLCSGYLIKVLQARSLFKRIALINAPTGIAMMLFLSVALHYGAGLKIAVYTIFVWSLVILIMYAREVRRFFQFRIDRATYNRAEDLFKYGFIIYLGTIVVFLDSKIDLFFVNYYIDKESLAVYNYAIEIVMLLNLVGSSISQVNYPALCRFFAAGDTNMVSHVMSQSLSFGFFSTSIVALFIAFHAEYLLPLILPPKYLEMLDVLYILVAGMVIFSTLAPIGTIMSARGTPKYDLWIVSFALMLNVGLNLFLVPRYGMIGAAIATIASFAFRGMAGLMMLRFVIGPVYPYFRLFAFWLLLLASVFAGVVSHSLIFKEIIILGYATTIWIFLLGLPEREQVREKLSRLLRA